MIQSLVSRSITFLRAPSLALALLALAGCGPQPDARRDADRALIDVPAVGDLYAAELTRFSTADFEGADTVYGLMKVVAVEPDKVTVVTEDAGSDDKAVPRQDLLGDLSDIGFDEGERIDIVHSELAKAYEAGEIFAVRR